MRLSRNQIEKEIEELTVHQEKVDKTYELNETQKAVLENDPLNTPPQDRWQTGWSAPRPGRSLPKPLNPEQLKALNDAARNR